MSHAVSRAPAAPPTVRRPAQRSRSSSVGRLGRAPRRPLAAAPALADGPDAARRASRPTIHYEEARGTRGRPGSTFAPGGRVTVGFTPRAGDHWKVGGVSPRALPAGRLDGRQLRERDKPAPEPRPPATPENPNHPRHPSPRLPRPRPGARRVRSAFSRALGPARRRRPTADRPGRGRRRGTCVLVDDGRGRPIGAERGRQLELASAARSSGSCRTGSSATARRRSTSRRSRRSPTSASGIDAAGNLHEAEQRRDDDRWAGAAGPARG